MQTLSKGYKLPETGDFGNVFFPALEANIQLANSHKHDGVDGERISAIDLDSEVSQVLVGSFANIGPGVNRALVTVPNGRLFDDVCVTAKDPTTKEVFYLQFERVSSTTFYVYMNIPQTIELYFGV